jgi:predicted acylesterase/phospholipase RssA
VGVIEELEAQGVRIDRVAAAGTGALIAAMLASGWSGAEIDAHCFNELVRRRPFSDYRPGRSSLIRGERVTSMLKRLFGDVWIEELPLQFACVSADLERGERVVHRSGPIVDALRAALAVPGLMAPVVDGERLLVDAGSIDNLPIATLNAEEGPIIVVDVAPREVGPQRVEPSRRGRHTREADAAVPTIAETLARTMVLGSCGAAESARGSADLSILPDTGGVGMLEFHQLDVLRAEGRAAVRDALAGQTMLEVDSSGDRAGLGRALSRSGTAGDSVQHT